MEDMSEDWENCCPLCMEEMDSTDRQLKPCRCGYQICVWCWNHIMEMAEKDSTEGRCPACRTPYDKEKIVSTAVSYDNNDKKQKPGKAKVKVSEGRRNLSNVRVIQRNLVYVVGIPAALADEETLERKEYFGQYGKILKISVSKPSGHNPQNSLTAASVSVYVTYVKEEDALRCIQAVNGCMLEAKVLKACFGTTKYCNSWLKNMPCNNPDCLYLHDEGTREDSFTKEEMLAKYGSKNQQFHDLTHPPQRRSGIGLPPPADATSCSTTSNPASSSGSMPIKVTSASTSLPKSSSLPAAASWGSRSNAAVPRLATVKNGMGPVASKPPAAISCVTLTGPGTFASGHLSSNNSDATKTAKANNEGGGSSRLSEPSADSSRLGQMLPLSTCVDNPCIDLGLPRNRQTSHSRNSSDVEASESTSTPLKEGKPVKLSCNQVSGVRETAVVEERDPTYTPSVKETSTKHSVGASMPFIECSQISNDKFQMLRDPATLTHSSVRTLDLDNRINQPLMVNSETSTHGPPDGWSTTEVHRVPQSQFSSQTPLGVDNLSISCHSAYDSRFENNGESPANDPWLHGDCVNNIPDGAPFTKNDATSLLDGTILAGKADSYECETSEKKGLDIVSEQKLISDMFATDFDIWTDGSPQDFAQLLFDRKSVAFPSSTPASTDADASWKTPSGSKQSRFQFARQDESTERILSSNNPVLQAVSGNDRSMWAEKASSDNFSGSLSEVSSSDQLLNKLHYSPGGSTTSHLSNARSPMSAPPGFSSIRASSVPPPGFAQHRRSEYIKTDVSNGTSSSFNQLQALDNLADVEFIDPAIMAVGRGKLPAGSSPTIPLASIPSLSGFLSQASPLSQQPRPLDFESGYQSHQDRPYRQYGSMNSVCYSNQDLDTSLPSLFHKSFNEPRFPAQYHDAMLPGVVMPESVYGNGVHEPNKLRLQHSTSWDDWSRISEMNAPRHQSVNDAVGRLAMSQLSLDRVLQSRLEELTLSKDLGSKHYGDVGLPNGHEEPGSLSSARIGRYF